MTHPAIQSLNVDMVQKAALEAIVDTAGSASTVQTNLTAAIATAAAATALVQTNLDAAQKCTINAQVGTTYTLALTDGSANANSPFTTLNNAAPVAVTVPTNASVAFPIGSLVPLAQIGAGKVTLVAAGGVTLLSQGGLLSVAAQYAGLSLLKTGTNTWLVLGTTIA